MLVVDDTGDGGEVAKNDKICAHCYMIHSAL